MVSGEHNHAAALAVTGQVRFQLGHALLVEGREGFVEDPQGRRSEVQAGQRDATLLALRQVFAGEVFAAGQTDLFQRVEGVVFRQGFVGQVGRGEEVFERGQFFLDGVQVAEIAQVGAEIVAITPDGLPFPANFSGFRR